jgi:putative DNA primase/helicase
VSVEDDDTPDVPGIDERGYGKLLPIKPRSMAGRTVLSRTLAGAATVLRTNMADVLEGRELGWNEMTATPTLDRRALQDVDVARFRVRCEELLAVRSGERLAPLRISKNDAFDAFALVARERSYHPVREYLRAVPWDGGPALEQLPALAGCDDTAWTRTLLRKWAVSCAARVLRPGCKVDTVLVLVGGQGIGKSTFFKTLASDEWFCDAQLEIGTDDACQRLEGVWIYELAELDAVRRSEWSAVKQFVTQARDKYHVRYDRLHKERDRDSVLVGTTNRREFLDDETGARRFWPITVRRKIDVAAVAAARRQIWSAAVAAFDAGEAWHLDEAGELELVAGQEDHAVYDEWTGRTLEWAEARVRKFQLFELFEDALKIPGAQQSQVTKTRVAKILRAAGFVDVKVDGRKYWRRRGEVF